MSLGYASPTRISYGTSQSPRQQHDTRRREERGRRDDGALEVLGEPPVAVDPGEEAFDHPTPRQHLIGQFADPDSSRRLLSSSVQKHGGHDYQSLYDFLVERGHSLNIQSVLDYTYYQRPYNRSCKISRTT